MANGRDDALRLPVVVPVEIVEYIAVRVAELLADEVRAADAAAAWLDVAAAAQHLGYADERPIAAGSASTTWCRSAGCASRRTVHGCCSAAPGWTTTSKDARPT